MAVRIRDLIARLEKLEAEVAELRGQVATPAKSRSTASKPKTQ